MKVVAVVVLAALALESSGAVAWPEPTQDSKPWVYNWWMGSAVDECGLEYQCRELAEKGFGGFHVIPIYGAKGYEQQWREYLSERWMEAFALAVKVARRHGLGVDLTTGSGWCFGGPQISPEHGAWGLKPLDGGKAPYVSIENTGQQVKRAGPGGQGLMMDPYSVEAMDAFLKPFTEAFGRKGAALPLRFYHDSFEYYGAGWTRDFKRRFAEKRGYDLGEHWAAFAGNRGDRDYVARLKCDYRETLSDLMVEDVFPRWVDWCHRRGIKTRNEAHGSPANWLDFYALSDCPETEMFGRDNRDVLISKFASSAAHVSGLKHVSAEACTWLNEHFCETPLDYKQMIDKLLLSGVNRCYYHGLCYSPPDAVWPGWCFYAASETNPRNPLWRDFGTFNAYVTRVQSVMHLSSSGNDLLVYWPIHDYWRKAPGFQQMMSVHKTKWFYGESIGRAAKSLYESGCNFDYVSDRLLEKVVPGGGYRTIFVPKLKSMPLKTAERLIALAEKGIEVVFESFPETVPGFKDHKEESAKLKKLFASAPERVKRMSVSELARSVRAEPFTRASGLSSWRRRAGGVTYYFVVNDGAAEIEGDYRLSAASGSIWAMDPVTGEITGCRTPDGSAHIKLPAYGSVILAASGERDAASDYSPDSGEVAETTVVGPWELASVCGGPKLPGPRKMEALSSWTNANDEEYADFSGTVRYRTEFKLDSGAGAPAVLNLGEVLYSARVKLNGKDLGCRFAPPHAFAVPRGVLKEHNELEVEVTNLGANRIRWNDRNKIYWKRFYDINYISVKGVWSGGLVGFDASRWPISPSGLMGPVTIEAKAD